MTESAHPLVGILCGSPSDLAMVAEAERVLSRLGISSERHVLSAHRMPEATAEYARTARGLCELRHKAGLSQRELARLVGTTASVICRLEDADYEGHSLGMLRRIAAALNRRVEIILEHKTEKVTTP